MAQKLIARIDADEYEVVTVYSGGDATRQESEQLIASLSAAHPHLEIELLEGGQAHYHFIMSAE